LESKKEINNSSIKSTSAYSNQLKSVCLCIFIEVASREFLKVQENDFLWKTKKQNENKF